jgi:hypothetical protein
MLRGRTRTSIIIFSLFCLALLPKMGSASQEPPVEPVESIDSDEMLDTHDLPMEEVTVFAERSRSQLRRNLYQIHYQVFDMFNNLNPDDEFDTICRLEARIGSQIKYRICKPRFLRALESDASVEFQDGNVYSLNRSKIDRMFLRQREIMADLANQNPEFLTLLRERLKLRREYEQKQRKSD